MASSDRTIHLHGCSARQSEDKASHETAANRALGKIMRESKRILPVISSTNVSQFRESLIEVLGGAHRMLSGEEKKRLSSTH